MKVASNYINVELGDVDPFSKLPIPICHRILSFLPSNYDTKEVTKLGFVSKSWLEACSSYPVLDFSLPSQPIIKYMKSCNTLMMQHFCLPRPCLDVKMRKTMSFMMFVDKCMSSSEWIQRFKLVVHWHVKKEEIKGFASTVDGWIDIAIENRVQDFYLSFAVHHKKHEMYVIPAKVLSSGSLKCLSLGHQVSLPRNCCVDLYSLRTLEILYAKIDNEDLVNLLRGCPLIENLTLRFNQNKLFEIVISGLKHIKKIDLCHLDTKFNLKVKVEAPSLETLCLAYLSWYSNFEFECCNLKWLKLVANLIHSEEWFCIFLSRLPMLESLEIFEHCPRVSTIKINHSMLKKLEFVNTHELRDIYIQSNSKLKILSFRFGKMFYSEFPSIHVVHPPSYFEFHIEKDLNLLLSTNFCIRLSELLSTIPSKHRSLSISIKQISVHKDGRLAFDSLEILKPMKKVIRWRRLPKCEIDELNLAIVECSLTYPTILNSLITIFHPTVLNVEIVDADPWLELPNNFAKFVCDNLAGIRAERDTCRGCSKHMTCWKHQLKDVKIQEIKGLGKEVEGLEWCKLFELLPTLRVGSKIKFRLEWVK